jgi:DNA-binding transcriptional regulator YhcF (GntR family)
MSIGQPSVLFRIDPRSGVPPYQQLVQQVRQALRVGWLEVGDQLPTVRDAVVQLAINPNTVLKAYRELEYEGLVAGRPGQGTFVVKTLADDSLKSQAVLRRSLERWFAAAVEAGLDDESIVALFETTRRSLRPEEVV